MTQRTTQPWRVAVATTMMLSPAVASAQEGDGLYGRLDRDLTLTADVAAGVWVDRDVRTTADVALRARYLDEVGLVVGYDRALTGDREDVLWAGVDLRPLMLGRWAYDLEGRSRIADLMVDSLGLDLGVAWLRPGGTMGAGSGFGFMLGTGVDIPLYWNHGDAVALRVALHWVDGQPWDTQGTGTSQNSLLVNVGLVFRTMVRAGLERGRR